MQLHVNELVQSGEVELVERKGIGHPDTICDALAEELSRALSRHYLEHFGRVLHHNVDKALLSGGAARAEFGGGKVLAPIRVFLGGRATSSVGAVSVPVAEIAMESTRNWFTRHLPHLNSRRHLRFRCQIHPGSRDLVELFERGRAPLVNDTSFGVGHAPLSALEAFVLAAEADINSEAFRAVHPEAGTDVKITALRRGSVISLTVARAFIGASLADAADYLAAKADTARRLEQLAAERGLAARVSVNAADDPDRDAFYITVLGTSAESGDDGQVGRGNRVNGLITPHRPMSLEAPAGKNPITHPGKLYSVLAREIAEDLVVSVPAVKAARCYMSSQIGSPIDDPQLVHVEIETHDALPPAAVAEPIDAIVRQHLAGLAQLSERLVEGRVRLF